MNVVVATAEPFAAYHLRPLVAAAEERDLDVRHLLPIAHPTQGEAFDTTTSLTAVFDADRVVVTGGRLNAWTEAVTFAATAAGIPAVFVELAYLDGAPHPTPPTFAAVLAASPASVELLSSHLGLEPAALRVVGGPLLDDLPTHCPEPRRLLALGTVSAESPDGGAALARALEVATAAGWDVVLRLHPRESRDRWEGFTLDDSPSAAHAAARASVALGYPGTAFVELAAMGVPLLGLASEPWMLERVPPAVAKLCTPVVESSALPDLLGDPRSVDPEVVAAVAGPVGGAAGRIWDAVAAADS